MEQKFSDEQPNQPTLARDSPMKNAKALTINKAILIFSCNGVRFSVFGAVAEMRGFRRYKIDTALVVDVPMIIPQTAQFEGTTNPPA